MAQPSRLERKLQGLRYPYGWQDADITVAVVKQLVVWLEDTKIMWWTIPQRKDLRETEDEKEWMNHLVSYARDMGYTKPVGFTVGEPLKDNSEVRALLDWVVGKGVRCHYSDGENPDKYSKSHEKYSSLGMSIVTKIKDPDEVLDIESEMQYDVSDKDSMQKILAHIVKLLGLPPSEDVESTLLLVSRTMSDIRCVETAHKGKKLDSAESILGSLPTEGFATVDPALEKAMKILRLLFLIDLSELQRRISEIFCELQSVTHNIKEDIRYGSQVLSLLLSFITHRAGVVGR